MKSKTVFLGVFLLLSLSLCGQVMSMQSRMALASYVQMDYQLTQMEGVSAHKVDEGYVLVSVVTLQNSSATIPQKQRIAQVKASRAITEWLNGAQNKSVSVYETASVNVESFSSKMRDNTNSSGSYVSSELSSDMKENSTNVTAEVFDDKIIQSAIGRTQYVEPLTRFVGPSGEEVFCHYLFLSKKAVKHK